MFFIPQGIPMGGMPMESEKPPEEVDNSRLYALLELEKDCSEADVRKAFKKLAMKHHPDRGGDEEKFKEISLAHEVLSDADRRKAYDQYGEESLTEDGPGCEPQNIFEAMFGPGGGGPKNKKPKTRDMVRPVWITLEEIYTSVTKLLPISRKVADESSEMKSCAFCGGKGFVVQMIRMGPILQQLQQTCPKCGGTGYAAEQKIVREVLEVFVEKGSPDGHKILFHGKSDENPGCDAGDVVVVVKEQDHPRFLRKGHDLYLEKEISLGEALTGFKLVVPHLDGRKLVVRSKPGEVLQPKHGGMAIKGVEGAGMPIHQDPFNFGNLFLVFSISFPRYIEPAAAADLRSMLGAGQSLASEDGEAAILEGEEVEEAVAVDIDPLESSKRHVSASEAYHEDENLGMACKQQ